MGKQDARQVAKDVHFQQWANIVLACQSSGMRNVDWCRGNGVNLATYYKWQRRVREAALNAMEKSSMSLAETTSTQPHSAMSPLARFNETQAEALGKKQQWDRVAAVAAWKKSKLSAAAWCKKQGIPTSTFHAWKKEAQEAGQGIVAVYSVPAEQSGVSPHALQPRFTELPALPPAAEEPPCPKPATSEAAIRIQMGGMVIEIQKEADARLAESVVRALAKQC